MFSYAPAGLVPLLVLLPRADRPGLLSDAPSGLIRGKHSCVGKITLLAKTTMRISSTILALACALGIIATPAAAQSITGTIVGRVTDPSDAVIVGARVRAINAATDATDSATTDDSGFYRLPNLLPGEYFVEVEAAGFQTTRVSAQRLSLADNLRLEELSNTR